MGRKARDWEHIKVGNKGREPYRNMELDEFVDGWALNGNPTTKMNVDTKRYVDRHNILHNLDLEI